MRIYDIRFQIISISLTIFFSVLINFTYGQEVNDTTSFDNDTIFEENLPAITVGERQASLHTKISAPILTSDKWTNFSEKFSVLIIILTGQS